MEELNETKSCPIKSICCSKIFIITLACLLCFFIGFYAGSKSAPKKTTNFNRTRTIMPANRILPKPQQVRKVTNAPKRIPTKQVATQSKNTKKATTKSVAKKDTTKTANKNVVKK